MRNKIIFSQKFVLLQNCSMNPRIVKYGLVLLLKTEIFHTIQISPNLRLLTNSDQL